MTDFPDPRSADDSPDPTLVPALAEIEAHVNAGGWDQRPSLFALVRAADFAARDPQTAARLGVDQLTDDTLTPIEQEALPDKPMDEALASIEWPAGVVGCALSQEIIVLPPGAEDEGGARPEDAAQHPDRREARLTVGVLADGHDGAALLRLRSTSDDQPDDVLTGPDLAPNLVEALAATFD